MGKPILIYITSLIFCSAMYGQECLDVKFKLRGYFYVGTSQIDSTALGGFYKAKNSPKNIDSKIISLSKDESFQIIVKVDSIVEYSKDILGFKVFIVNRSNSKVELSAQDSRIYLKRQVFYKNEWQDIEYLPSSWCGNSYHNVIIMPNQYWDLKAPCLQGKIPAKFRFKLQINDVPDSILNVDSTIYSNEFFGSFNKSQLHKEEGHTASGIMDPYNN
ncbi:hypothetical protein HME9304_02237 [Flagellimonas maritima]|uniref:Uncharacterized protein n=1 Tax=Flagellimonas maritima TaxID=1383885 RepID=A0A2Z4LTG8_9FLAO|nr:hypothetical protein [Allomuricauda aurantiaca]AWX45225.1 hypothetical protein HME9304_02237 [Allomuricauda aurantiaca]